MTASSDSRVYSLVPVRPAGREDLVYRAPETHGLEDKRVLLVGCGAIGSVIAEQLVRAGVGHLVLVDPDSLEPGNLSRHAGALTQVGMNKALAIRQRASEINPYVAVMHYKALIGASVPNPGARSETEELLELMSAVDIVVDATAETGVQQYTSVIARRAGTPWLCAEATHGIGGGLVVLLDPDDEACYSCLEWHRHEGTTPSPVAVETALVQPAGCSEPTFTGTGFDLSIVALQAVRAIVGRLLRGVPQGYPEDGHSLYVLELRDEAGSPVPPRWQGYSFGRHEKCGYHEV